MDPNANLQEQEQLLADLRVAEDNSQRRDIRQDLRELRQALRGWLDAGGFEPNWSACNRAAAYYGR